MYAFTRAVSPSIAHCELTHLARAPIDFDRAVRQHARYEAALAAAGCTLRRIDALPDAPDAVFVEDTAVVIPGLAILTRPGAVSRRVEVDSVAAALAPLLPLVALTGPATLDGGDVLRMGQTLYVGRSARTNEEGIRQLRAAVLDAGFRVQAVDFQGALHLKTAAGALDDHTVLIQPEWVSAAAFDGLDIIEIDPREPFAANVLRVGAELIVPKAHARTADRCARHVPRISLVAADELARAEGGVTCCSILIQDVADA